MRQGFFTMVLKRHITGQNIAMYLLIIFHSPFCADRAHIVKPPKANILDKPIQSEHKNRQFAACIHTALFQPRHDKTVQPFQKTGRHDRNLLHKVIRHVKHGTRTLEYFRAALIVQNHVSFVVLPKHRQIIIDVVHVQSVFETIIRAHGVR